MIRRAFLALSMIVPAGAVLAQSGSDLFGQKQIVQAVVEGDEEKVRQALLKQESPNQTANNGQPLLVVAVRAGHIPVVETLLKGGAIPDASDRDGYTALMRAAEKGDVEITDILLRRNASTRTQNRQGQTALMIASGRGYAEIVRLLLDKSKNNCTIFLTPGNHDAFLRKAIGIDLGNIFLDDHFCHETADGERLLVIHGDQFDKTVKFLPLAMLGTWMFEWVSVFNAKRSKLKGPGTKVGTIKKKFKKMISSLTSFEDKLAWQASLSGFDGVVCGHIHRPEIREIDEIKYCNTGDWVENCTAIVEHEDGRLELLSWDQISKMIQDVQNSTENLAVVPSEVP